MDLPGSSQQICKAHKFYYEKLGLAADGEDITIPAMAGSMQKVVGRVIAIVLIRAHIKGGHLKDPQATKQPKDCYRPLLGIDF